MQITSVLLEKDLATENEKHTRVQPSFPLDKSCLRYFVLACDSATPGGPKRAHWQKKFAERLHQPACGVCGAELSEGMGVVANIVPVTLGGSRKSQNDWLCCEPCAKSIRNCDPLMSPRFCATESNQAQRLLALEFSKNHALPWKALKGNDSTIRAFLADRWAHPRAHGLTYLGNQVGIVAFLARTHSDAWLGALRLKLRRDGIDTRVNEIENWRILSWHGLFNEYALASLIETNVLLTRVHIDGWEESTVMVGGVQWWRTCFGIAELRLREADHLKREQKALKASQRVHLDLDSD